MEDQQYGQAGFEEDLTALQQFAKWLKDVPKDTVIQVAKSKKTIVFIRQDI